MTIDFYHSDFYIVYVNKTTLKTKRNINYEGNNSY